MKQHITIEQLNELGEKGKKQLRKWYYPKRSNGDLIIYHEPINPVFRNTTMIFGERPMYGDPTPLLSIGQMIEFLDEHDVDILTSLQCEQPAHDFSSEYMFKPKDWCDALWEAVKEILNKENK